jgi:CspA family cold shock protein
MNFSDKWETDEEGNRFVFTVEMQRKLHKAGLPVKPESLGELSSVPTPQPITYIDEEELEEAPKQEAVEEPLTIQIDPATGKYLGRLKWYNPARGYGFIARGGGEDIFFHKTGALVSPTDLDEGQWVLYDVEHRKKGPEATEVEAYEGNPTE